MNSEVTKLPKKKISELKPHPKNAEIYGQETVSDLVKEIEASGYISPIMITHDNIIVSGNRRHRACVELGIDEVEVIVRRFENEFDILEALVRENDVREKTNLQKANEAAVLLLVEGEKAKLRMSLGGKGRMHQGTAEPPYLPMKGEARNIVAAKLGFKSGREVERAMNAAQAIKEAEDVGDVEKAEILKGQLERSPATAEELARNWDKIDKEKLEEQKDELKTGKKSAYGLFPPEKKLRKKVRSDKTTEKDGQPDPIAAILPATTYYPAKKQRITDYILAGINMLGGFIVNLQKDFDEKLPQVEVESERDELRIALRNYLNEIEVLFKQI